MFRRLLCVGRAENQRENDEGRNNDDHVPARQRFAELFPTRASELGVDRRRHGLLHKRNRTTRFGLVVCHC